MRRLREEDGIALITATIIMMILLGLAAGLLSFTANQTHASGRENAHEIAYSLAEAALNAQISKLGAQWATSTEWTSVPTSCAPTNGVYPTGCQCNNTSTFTGCPSSTGSWQNAAGYTAPASSRCPPGTQQDAWGSGATSSWSNVSNGWTTYVRDDGTWNGTSTTSLFNSSADQAEVPYDANSDGAVWVRAVGTYQCQTAVVISKVAEQITSISFPHDAVTANSIVTGNTGNKVILDTTGANGTYPAGYTGSGSAGQLATRCTGITSGCASYRNGQINSDSCGSSTTVPNPCTDYPSTPATTLDSNGLAALKSEAEAYGTWFTASNYAQTYWGAKPCPTSESQLASVAVPGGVAPVYIDTDCPSLSFTGNTTINSAAQPGFLVLTDQTLSLAGGEKFYGFIYDANLCSPSYTTCTSASSSPMITVTGNASIQGAVNVDGGGSVQFGQSKTNFIYDSRVWALLTEFGGANTAPNSFRQLPITQ